MVWRPLLKQTKRELAASCVAARSMEWVLSRLVEARHWAQYAVRRGATSSSVTKFSAAISSFRKGHQVTNDCQSEDLIKLREEGLLLLDRLKQITPWVSLWKNVASGQGEEEHFQQMEEAQLEEAGMQVSAELDERGIWSSAKSSSTNTLRRRRRSSFTACFFAASRAAEPCCGRALAIGSPLASWPLGHCPRGREVLHDWRKRLNHCRRG